MELDRRQKNNGHMGVVSRFRTFIEVWLGKCTYDRITILASGISFSTLIAIVPFISFFVAFLSLFDLLLPFFTLLNEMFTRIFGDVAGGELARMIQGYSMNTRGLGAFGLLSFIATSILLINKVWSVVNQVYRSAISAGSVVRRSAGFLTTLVISAILLGSYIGTKSLLSSWMGRLLGWGLSDTLFITIIKMIIPWLIGWIFLFFILISAPEAKVNRFSAAIGAAVGTVGTALVNALFSALISNIISYSVIYGSFAAIFLFLLWVYSLWVVILGAVEISYVHQYQPEKASLKKPVSPAEQLANGINVMMVIGNTYRQGEGETKIRAITDRLLMNERQLFAVLDLLGQKGFILPTNRGRTAFVPARPLEDLKIVELVSALYGEVYLEQNLDTIGDAIASQIDEKGIKTLGQLSIAHLIERV
ncbi:MAG: YihY/virulence factor BrkB family protein [Sphaerochaetaceae bacterium]